MKALSVKQPWANLIASGQKTIETRLWRTDYRGQLLICSSRNPAIYPAGFALCTVELVDCRMMRKADEVAACCPIYGGAYAWVLQNIQRIPVDRIFPVRGQLRIFEVSYGEKNI